MPQKKLLGGAYSLQGDLANLRHSRTNERIGHILRPNLWNSNSTHISPKVISTTVALFARFVFRRLQHITHHLSAHVHHLGHPPHHLLHVLHYLLRLLARLLVSYHALHILHHSAHWRSTFVLVGLKCTDH